MARNAQIAVSLNATDEGNSAFGGPYWSGAISAALSLGDGTTANKFDRVYIAERTVASATNDDIDLAGVLTTALGTTITAAELVAIMLINGPKAVGAAANTTNLTIGGGTNPVVGFSATGDIIGPIRPGGVFLLAAGDAAGIGAVTAGTGDILRIANSSGASATYQIAILARTA